MTSDDEVRLAEGFVTGDEAALRAAYDRWGRLVFALGLRSLPDRVDAEDITQQTFVTAWRGRHTFDPHRGTLPALVARHRAPAGRRPSAVLPREPAPARLERTEDPPAPEPSADRVLDRIVAADELTHLVPPSNGVSSSSRSTTTSHMHRSPPSPVYPRYGQESPPAGDRASPDEEGGGRCRIPTVND